MSDETAPRITSMLREAYGRGFAAGKTERDRLVGRILELEAGIRRCIAGHCGNVQDAHYDGDLLCAELQELVAITPPRCCLECHHPLPECMCGDDADDELQVLAEMKEGDRVLVEGVVTAFSAQEPFVRVRLEHAGGTTIPAFAFEKVRPIP